MYDLHDYLLPINIHSLNEDEGYNDGQIAKHILINEGEIPSLDGVDIVLLGIGETRGSGAYTANNDAPDAIRKQFFQLHYWHKDITLADLGNIKPGASLNDSYAALGTVLAELLKLKKTVVILGGSHDVTLAQYFAYRQMQQVIEATCIDAAIDLHSHSPVRSNNFLLEMLTSEPNVIKHYNHIGFQSYLVHPGMLETMDKLRFDCYRVGKAKENIEEMEPVIRNAHMLSFDISAIKNSDAPANTLTPNGFTGEEACILAQYGGLSTHLNSFGIYGYDPKADTKELTAKQIAQMLWYFMDGKSRSKQEVRLDEQDHFNEFHTVFAEINARFVQSRKTGRWWMELPDQSMIACSYTDYLHASHNQIPERWLRAQERL